MSMKMTNRLFLILLIPALLGILGSCSGENATTTIRKSQDEVQLPPPVFNTINWPAPYTELVDEGRLVITGNLECPVGYNLEPSIAVYVFPEAAIDPPLPELVGPPMTYEQLQVLLYGNPKVQEWLTFLRDEIFRIVTEGPFIPDEFLRGAHCYPIAQSTSNEFNYVNVETGDFRIDLDDWARLKSGKKLIILFAIDQAGQTTTAMNIFEVPVFFPDLLVGLNSDAMDFGQRMTSLASALFEVLSVSGDGRGADIALMVPFFSLADAAYSTGYNVFNGDTFISDFNAQTADMAVIIGDPLYRDAYLDMADGVAMIYEATTWDAWNYNYTLLEGEDNLYTKYQNAHQHTHDNFNEVTEQWNLIERGGGIKELTVQVYEGEDIIAQISVIGDPGAPLSVIGFIGEHQIIPDDYNPYFLEIFSIFHEEWIFWPPYGI